MTIFAECRRPYRDILVCEDHPFLQLGLEVSLRRLFPNLNSLRMVSSGAQALQLVTERKSDLVIVDLGLPDMSGVELIQKFKQTWPDSHILVLTGCDSPATLLQAQKAGAAGIVQKSASSLEQLANALNHLDDEAPFFDSKTQTMLRDHGGVEFTQREYEILLRIIEGQPNQKIAQDLGCALTTVRFHRANILNKTNVRNAAELSAWFMQGKRPRY